MRAAIGARTRAKLLKPPNLANADRARLTESMARMRKAARIWRNPAAQILAQRVMIPHEAVALAIEPATLFVRAAPLEVELGAGKGDFIIARAAATPERNFLAVELASSVSRLLAVRAGRNESDNLRVLRADARTLVNLMLPDQSVTAYHIYFPDPWPKERHVKHRLFTAHFASSLKRTLAPAGGRVFVATDVGEYALTIFAIMAAAEFVRCDEPVPGADRTNFGRKYLQAGRPVFSGAFGWAPAREA
jgi:tRNA (guanine-N7-)-methyltransferase